MIPAILLDVNDEEYQATRCWARSDRCASGACGGDTNDNPMHMTHVPCEEAGTSNLGLCPRHYAEVTGGKP